MKTKITALAISVIMMCSMMSSCGKKEIQMHTYEAIVNGEAFKLTYPVASDEENLKTEEEMVEIDVAAANAVADALFMFSEENSAGVGEINKSVDAVFEYGGFFCVRFYEFCIRFLVKIHDLSP